MASVSVSRVNTGLLLGCHPTMSIWSIAITSARSIILAARAQKQGKLTLALRGVFLCHSLAAEESALLPCVCVELDRLRTNVTIILQNLKGVDEDRDARCIYSRVMGEYPRILRIQFALPSSAPGARAAPLAVESRWAPTIIISLLLFPGILAITIGAHEHMCALLPGCSTHR